MPVAASLKLKAYANQFSETASTSATALRAVAASLKACAHPRAGSSRAWLPVGWHTVAVAVTVAVLCTDVDEYVCRHAAMAVDAWNEAAGRPLFVMSETHPAHGQKVMLQAYFEPQGNCGSHSITKSGAVSVIRVNMLNRRRRCRLLPTLLHELGHRLGLQHDGNPLSWSVMRVRPKAVKPSRRDIERLNAIRAGDGAD